MLRTLADAAALAPATARIDPDHLIPVAFAFAREVYPHLMRPAVNAVPFWQEWFDSFPGYSRRKFALGNYLFRRKRALWRAGLWLAPPALAAGFGDALLTWFALRVVALSLWQLIAALVVFDITSTAALFIAAAMFLIFTDRYRRLGRYRKQIAALLSARYGLAPGGLSVLLEDDDAFALLAQRFLGEHHVPYTLPLYDRDGRYLFAAPGKVAVLASALLRAVGRGRDNELFVLLVDLLELDESLDPLLKAVRVAVSRHHQVVVVVPWPTGMRPPSDEPEEDDDLTGTVHALLGRATTRRFHRAYHRLRRTFTRLGVQVVCAVGEEPVPLILERIQRPRAPRGGNDDAGHIPPPRAPSRAVQARLHHPVPDRPDGHDPGPDGERPRVD